MGIMSPTMALTIVITVLGIMIIIPVSMDIMGAATGTTFTVTVNSAITGSKAMECPVGMGHIMEEATGTVGAALPIGGAGT